MTVETKGAGKPVVEASPSAAGPSAASSLGGLRHGRPLARLSRGAGALRLLHPQRQPVELPRRPRRAQAPLPRRGRPGRRRDRPDQQHRHAAEAADRVQPERGSTGSRPRSPRAPPARSPATADLPGHEEVKPSEGASRRRQSRDAPYVSGGGPFFSPNEEVGADGLPRSDDRRRSFHRLRGEREFR